MLLVGRPSRTHLLPQLIAPSQFWRRRASTGGIGVSDWIHAQDYIVYKITINSLISLKLLPTLVGVPEIQWNSLYYRPLHAFAAFVQLLPASEANHHSAPGGMLEHGLTVVINALKLRRGKLLPSGTCAEELTAQSLQRR